MAWSVIHFQKGKRTPCSQNFQNFSQLEGKSKGCPRYRSTFCDTASKQLTTFLYKPHTTPIFTSAIGQNVNCCHVKYSGRSDGSSAWCDTNSSCANYPILENVLVRFFREVWIILSHLMIVATKQKLYPFVKSFHRFL